MFALKNSNLCFVFVSSATKFNPKDVEDIEVDSIFEEERNMNKNKNM